MHLDLRLSTEPIVRNLRHQILKRLPLPSAVRSVNGRLRCTYRIEVGLPQFRRSPYIEQTVLQTGWPGDVILDAANVSLRPVRLHLPIRIVEVDVEDLPGDGSAPAAGALKSGPMLHLVGTLSLQRTRVGGSTSSGARQISLRLGQADVLLEVTGQRPSPELLGALGIPLEVFVALRTRAAEAFGRQGSAIDN